jgi:4-oxalocrotonate tautomerase
MAKRRTIEQKRAFVKGVTDLAVAALNVEPAWVTVVIDEYDRENWATDGETHSDKFGEGFGINNTGESL